ncbi:hypothetical protein DFJ74DRAFT_638359 [Hyaloraphidium curvatum]|nr:hypothetical protein DFJ74DRAFT_638359 [Hyaloraphidium curvatum]
MLPITLLAALPLLLLAAPAGAQAPQTPACYQAPSSNVTLTSYWIPIEGSVDDNGPLDGPRTVVLNECVTNRTIELVANETYRKCHLEGTCRLQSGELVNLGPSPDPKNNPCFVVLGPNEPYGHGSKSNPLVPWISVATNDLPFGTVLYVPRLNGTVVPGSGGKRHNGCLRVDDVGWSFDGCHVDIFVLSFANYVNVTSKLQQKQAIRVSNATACPLQDYVGFTGDWFYNAKLSGSDRRRTGMPAILALLPALLAAFAL